MRFLVRVTIEAPEGEGWSASRVRQAVEQHVAAVGTVSRLRITVAGVEDVRGGRR